MAQASIPKERSADNSPQADVLQRDVEKVLRTIEPLLLAGKPNEALEAVRRSRISSPWMTHAAGICQLRLGHTSAAISAYRGLVLTSGVNLRDEVPAVFKLNFAVALLADGNIGGFRSALAELRDNDHPAVARYRRAFEEWKATWPWWRRVFGSFVGPPETKFSTDFPLGELR